MIKFIVFNFLKANLSYFYRILFIYLNPEYFLINLDYFFLMIKFLTCIFPKLNYSYFFQQ